MSQSLPKLSQSTAHQLLNASVVAMRQNWSVLKASGPGLRDFLQGQITQDMARLSASTGIHSCILTPQGKAVSELYILAGQSDELIILTPASRAEATVARLRQFTLGKQLRIGLVDTLAICSVQGANAAAVLAEAGLPEPGNDWLACSRKQGEDSYAIVMPEKPRGFWLISSPEHIQAVIDKQHASSESELEAMRIIRGLPDFGREWDESIHPLNANLIEFDGVSFDKGCYVGQEVTSRMHWRGGIKKKLYRVTIHGHVNQLPCPVLSSARIGELKSAAIDHEQRCIGIALLPISSADTAMASTEQPVLRLENGADITVLEACHA